MIIEYKTLDGLQSEKIELTNAIDIKINGIKINERGEGIYLSVESNIVVIPMASNKIIVTDGTKKSK